MTPEARAARERKQKIFVAVGGVLLLGLLAIQVPKLLGGSGSSQPAATGAAATTPVVTPPAGSSTTPAAGTPVAATTSPTSAVRPALPTTGKLSSFGLFGQKDPFVQLVATSAVPADASAPSSSPGPGKVASPKPAGTSGASAARGFTVGAKSGAAAPALTVVSVNGERQALAPGGTFPASDPVFVLVAESQGSKSVRIGVVGGAYAGGSATTKLTVGKPLTLVNTATGARYRLKLVAVGSGQTATPAKSRTGK